jgi:hypothetical protein
MKHISTSFIFACFMLCLQTNSFGQFKKYVLVEHFTNTKCSICASKNPQLFTTLDLYPNDVHHISIHPSTPYNTCELYLANPVENQARANFFNVQGTPQVFLNGTAATINNQLASKIATQATAQSLLNIKVENTPTATGRHGKITLQVSEDIHSQPSQGYKIFVAVVEKTLNYSSPNGETVHHNVFRDYWGTNGLGQSFTLPTFGNPTVIEQDFTYDPTWNANEMYLMAYVQNMDTKEILNSGTEFDPIVSSVKDNFEAKSIRFTPNPANDLTTINAGENNIKQVELYNLAGKQVIAVQNIEKTMFDLNLSACKSGIYIAKVTTSEGVFSQKLVKI